MNKNRSLAIVALALTAMAACKRTELYASPTGSGNECSKAKPCTLIDARNKARALNGDMREDIVVILRGGTYELAAPFALDPIDSGSNGFFVTYAAAQGEVPVLSGGRRIAQWKQSDPIRNIWFAPVTNGLRTRQLFVDGHRALRARSAGGLNGGVRLGTKGYTMPDTAMSTWRNPEDIEFVYQVKWTEQRCGVDSIAGNRIDMKQPCFGNSADPNRAGMTTVDMPSYIENAFELLDEPGEWYLDRPGGRIYYIPRPGENLATATVVAPVLERLLSGSGTPTNPIHHIAFNGLTFAHTTWLRPSGGDGFSELQANFALVGVNKDRSKLPAALTLRAARSLRFERDVFAHLGAGGLTLEHGCQENVIVGNVFTDISGTGLQLGDVDDPAPPPEERTTGNSVISNYFHDLPVEYHGGVGLWVGYATATSIAQNELERLPYTAISIGWGWGGANYSARNRIIHNLIHDHMRLLFDGGGIYSNGIQGSAPDDGELIQGNVVHAQAHEWGGIYLDEGSQYVTVIGNLTYDTPRDVFQNLNLVPVTIQDNFTDLGAAPASLVSDAGLYPAYLGIK